MNNREQCAKELNEWIMSKDWPKSRFDQEYINKYKVFSPSHIKKGILHCYPLQLMGLIGLINDKSTQKKYVNYLLEVITPILKKYNIIEMNCGNITYIIN